jgi:anti-sigma factor RsiW
MNEHEHENCKQLLSSLGDYVDGALTPELCAEIERHMSGCKKCRVVVNTLRKTVELYHETAEDTVLPADVRQRLYVRLHLEDYMSGQPKKGPLTKGE